MPEPHPDEIISATLEVARRLLGMEVAHLGRFIDGYRHIEEVPGTPPHSVSRPGCGFRSSTPSVARW
ncbi:hypothetical protein [Conexibacter sp. DBS9H8]|uniref:hypothetical protein n=1 Tax=Conexibacter sp. DBS9H8 TaxID=2937801 RepID=UPI00200E66DE|nr:hypothetical protein [Conexibacter sp. DBS9H8]